MHRIILGIFIGMVFAIVACKDEQSEEPTPASKIIDNSFPVKFVFVQHDKEMKYAFVTSYYYDKAKDSTFITSTDYRKTQQSPQFYLKDSIVHREFTGSLNSRKLFELKLYFYDTISGAFLRGFWYKSTKNLDWGDTIIDSKQGIELFRWPQDTAKYIKIDQW